MKDKKRNYITGSKFAKKFVEEGFDFYAGNIQIDMNKAEELSLSEDKYVLENKKILINEKSVVDYDGIIHWYKVHKIPILDEQNSTNGIVTIAQNIDNEKLVENQKEMFIATLTHDLKNPLQAQIKSLELLYREMLGTLNEEQKDMISITIESTRNLNEMLYSMLSTYKYDNGIVQLDKSLFDIHNLIGKCIKEFSAAAKDKNIELIYHSKLKEKDTELFGDVKQIRRVLTNLLTNSLYYGFKNSKIKLKTYRQKDNIIFSVENSSPEIPDEIKNKIFEKYTSGAQKFQKVGIGLGLYLSKKVVEAHDGKIYLEAKNTQNKFIFEIPCTNKNSATNNCIKW